MINLFYFFVPLVLLSIVINRLLINTPLKYIYPIIVRPGVIVHELSHYIACLITFAPVKKISFFEKNGGYVKYSPSGIPVIGDLIISLAPTIIGSAIIIFVGYKFGFKIESTINHVSLKDITAIENYYRTINFWLYLYIVLSVGITFIPSHQDIKNCIFGIIGLIVLFYIFREQAFVQNIFSVIANITPIVIFPLLITFLLIFIIFMLNKFIFKLR